MANRYWVGGSGTWDDSATTHWSASSGGAGGASVPGTTDDVIFDTASNTTSYTVTFNGTYGYCQNLTLANPASGTLTINGSGNISIYGSLLVSSTINFSHLGIINFSSTTTGKTITLNGTTLYYVQFGGFGGEWTLQDTFRVTRTINIIQGSLVLNNKDIYCSDFESSNTNTRALTIGTGNIYVTTIFGSKGWNFSTTTNLTFSGASGSIYLDGISANRFYGGGLTYGTLYHRAKGDCSIRGANTFSSLNISRNLNDDKIIRFESNGITHTITNSFIVNNNAANATVRLTSDSTTAAILAFNGTYNNVSVDYVTADYLTGSTPYKFYMGDNSTDGGNNTNIYFYTRNRTISPSVLALTSSSQTPVIQTEGLKNSLVAYYKMEGNSQDSVGTKHGNDTFMTYDNLYGKILQGAKFDGNSSYILLPDTVVGGDSFSYSMWVYANTASSNYLYNQSYEANSSAILLSNGVLRLTIKTDTYVLSSFDSAPGVVILGQYNHIVRSYDTSTGYLDGYVNNVRVIHQYVGGKQSYGASTGQNVLGCLKNISGVSLFHNGYMDEVAFYARGLEEGSVALLYNSNTGLQHPFTSIIVSVQTLIATIFSLGFLNVLGKGVSTMRSVTKKYILGMDDKSVL